tara:strand:- start:20 stop:418 length:399 start_codon:yes stop_codon:yes gene_type:complete
MPRKKIPPPPLDEAIELSSGLVIEIGSVEVHAHRSTARGRSQVIKCGNKNDGLLEHVFNDYFIFADSADGHGKYCVPEKDYMRNPSAFANHISNTNLADPNGPDTKSLRMKHYPEIKAHIEALQNALKALYD